MDDPSRRTGPQHPTACALLRPVPSLLAHCVHEPHQQHRPKGNDKQIDYILTKRRHLKHIKDAEANDMIHRGSDHRCVMAIFTISMPGKNSNHKDMKGKHDTVKRERSTQTSVSISIEKLEKYQEIVETTKIPPPHKEMKHMTQGRTQKHKSKEKTLQQQKLTAHLRKQKHKRSKEEA